MKKIIISAYVGIQVLIFFVIVIFETILKKNFDYYIIHYISICLNFVMAIYLYISKSLNKFITLALFFTLIADTGLVLLGDYYNLSVCFFILAQISYFIYLHFGSFKKKEFMIELIILSVFICILQVVAYLVVKTFYSLLVFLTLIYISLFINNIVKAIIEFKKTKSINILFVIGLLLFICCDVCVGLTNFDYFEVGSIFNYLVWIFYEPSQTLIVLGTINKKVESYF